MAKWLSVMFLSITFFVFYIVLFIINEDPKEDQEPVHVSVIERYQDKPKEEGKNTCLPPIVPVT
jgi:hypothetical protein